MFQSNKKNIIFLIIFTLVCIAITTAAILLTNNMSSKSNNDEEKESDKIEINPDGLGIKSLEDRYAIQNLQITIKKEYPEEKIDDEYPVEIHYFEISGLKNSDIEKAINKEIKDIVFSKYKKGELKEKNLDYIYIDADFRSSFGNTLSVLISKDSGNIENETYYEEWIGLNYDLNTGKKIEFSDLFTNDANIKSILTQSAYMTFAQSYLGYSFSDGEYEEWNGDMNKIDYSSIEDNVLKVMQNYNKNNTYQFYFDERRIVIDINGEEISIEMRNFYKQIAIYNRYLSDKSLFKKESDTELYVFMEYYEDIIPYKVFEKVDDNLFLDLEVISWGDIDEPHDINIDKYKKEINEQIKLAKKYLNEHKDKAIVLSYRIELNTEDSVTDVDKYLVIAKMSKTYFNETMFPKILDLCQEYYSGYSDLVYFLALENDDNKNIELEVHFPERYEMNNN